MDDAVLKKPVVCTCLFLLLIAVVPGARADCNEINYVVWKLIADGSVEELKSNLEIGKSNGCTPWSGFRDELALVHAATVGNYEAAKLLIEFGIDVNAGNRDNSTALDYAARSRDTLLMEMLLSGGATVQWQSMQFALENGFDETVGRLAAGFSEMDQALVLFLRGEEQRGKFYQRDDELLKTIRVLIHNGAGVNRISEQFTPLTMLAWSFTMEHDTRLKAARLLVDNGADVNQKDGWGNNALLIAAARRGAHYDNLRKKLIDDAQGNYEFVRFLLDRGATTFVVNGSDYAPPIALALVRLNLRIAFLLGWKIVLAVTLLLLGLCYYWTWKDIGQGSRLNRRQSIVASHTVRLFVKVFSMLFGLVLFLTAIILVAWLWGYL